MIKEGFLEEVRLVLGMYANNDFHYCQILLFQDTSLSQIGEAKRLLDAQSPVQTSQGASQSLDA